MDNGHVIPALNEDWTFAGAKVMELAAGLMSSILHSLFFEKPAQYMPFLVLAGIGTALALARLRMSFPDEERGVRHYFMTICGFPPPGIPSPARLQPRWSGGRIADVRPMSLYAQLGLEGVVNKRRDEVHGL